MNSFTEPPGYCSKMNDGFNSKGEMPKLMANSQLSRGHSSTHVQRYDTAIIAEHGSRLRFRDPVDSLCVT